MSRRFIKLLIVIVMGFAAFAGGAAVAQDSQTVTSDFSVEADPPGWQVDWSAGGSWGVDGGTLNGSGHAWYSYVAHPWSDLEVRLAMQLDGGLHVNLRADENRYRIGIEHPDEGSTRLQLWRDADGTNELIDEVGPEDVGENLEVFASVHGEHLEVEVNGLIIRWDDPEPLPAGKFGFESLPHTNWVQIDFVSLQGTTVPVPPPEPPGVPDLALIEFIADPIDQSRIHILGILENQSDTPAAGGRLTVEFEGNPVGVFPFEGPVGPGRVVELVGTVEVVADAAGIAGEVTGRIETGGEDLSEANNFRRVFVELSGSPPPATTPPSPVTTVTSPVETPPPADGDPWERYLGVGGGVVLVGVGGAVLRRRWWRKTQQNQAVDEPCQGECRPGEDRYTKRDYEPDLALRRITALELTAIDPAGARNRLAKIVQSGDALDLLNRALRCDRRADRRGRDQAIRRASSQVADAIVQWLPRDRTILDIWLIGTYKGGKTSATFTHWVCGNEGQWPDATSSGPTHKWTAEISDEADLRLGQVRYLRSTSSEALMRSIEPMLAKLVGLVSERSHPAPSRLKPGIHVE